MADEPNAFDIDAKPSDETLAAASTAGTKAILIYSRLLDKETALRISGAGMDVVVLAEWGGAERVDYYTEEQGKIDAERAFASACEAGMPDGMGIYFVFGDFDPSEEQIRGPISAYARAVGAAAPSGQGIGGYGNGATCSILLEDGLISKAFCMAGRGTNGTEEFMASGKAVIQQFVPKTEFGASVDPDFVTGDYWGWKVGGLVVVDSPAVEVSPVEGPADPPESWYTRLLHLVHPPMQGQDVEMVQKILGDVTVDGIYGEETHESVARFQKKNRIPVDGSVGPITARVMEAAQLQT